MTPHAPIRPLIGGFALLVCSAGLGFGANVSFLVDPATIDISPADGFITGTEFSPVGDDGTVFTLEPTNNLVGFERFLLNINTGLHYGGGGGSTLEFQFSTNQPIQLNSYTIADTGFILGNPTFDVLDGVTPLSVGNDSTVNGTTYNFNGGPLSLEANTVYTVNVTTAGAGIQSFVQSWNYDTVPEPSTAFLGLLGGLLAFRRRRA